MNRTYSVERDGAEWIVSLIEDGACFGAWSFRTKREALAHVERLRATYEDHDLVTRFCGWCDEHAVGAFTDAHGDRYGFCSRHQEEVRSLIED